MDDGVEYEALSATTAREVPEKDLVGFLSAAAIPGRSSRL
jgi:hypothetical protein